MGFWAVKTRHGAFNSQSFRSLEQHESRDQKARSFQYFRDIVCSIDGSLDLIDQDTWYRSQMRQEHPQELIALNYQTATCVAAGALQSGKVDSLQVSIAPDFGTIARLVPGLSISCSRLSFLKRSLSSRSRSSTRTCRRARCQSLL